MKRSEGSYSTRSFVRGSMTLSKFPTQARNDNGLDEKTLGEGQKPQFAEDKLTV
jgi:hypothetical protein